MYFWQYKIQVMKLLFKFKLHQRYPIFFSFTNTSVSFQEFLPNKLYSLIIDNSPDMPLANKHTSMMDRFGQTQFEHLSLQASLQKVLDFQTQNVIELHMGLIQHTDPYETT